MAEQSSPGHVDQPTVQHESIDAKPILGFIIIMFFVLGGLVWGATYWFIAETEIVRQRTAMEARYPDLERIQTAAQARLNRYAQQPDSSYIIPVERAIALLSKEFPADTRVTAELP